MSRCTGFALGLGAAAALVASPARAHFILQAPASWAEQGPLGDPQKSGPCGQADPGRPRCRPGMVTAYAPGDTVTVTINETVTHPGHYRVVAVDDGPGRAPRRSAGDARAARPADRRRSRTRRCTRCSPTGCWCTPPRSAGAVVHGQAAEQHDLHQQLRAAGRRVHVGPRAQQPGRLLLSPLREHHDRRRAAARGPAGRRHGMPARAAHGRFGAGPARAVAVPRALAMRAGRGSRAGALLLSARRRAAPERRRRAKRD